jgi:hypothetical protein
MFLAAAGWSHEQQGGYHGASKAGEDYRKDTR